jgi:cytochrome c oxidase cbb3-type subunit 3
MTRDSWEPDVMAEQLQPEAWAGGRVAALAAAGAAGVIALSIVNGGLMAHAQPVEPVERIVEPTGIPDAARSSVPAAPHASEDNAAPQSGTDPDPGPSSAEDEGAASKPGVDVDIFGGGGGTASELVHVPVTKLFPGAVPVNPSVVNPVAGDPEAVQRGMTYFNQMNCIGCHAPNGAGGMGPSLSNATFFYGSAPENIYLSILQGRPDGMPAWGGMLPDQVIWDLVAYIQSISKDRSGQWGTTTSVDGFTTEQVPAEYLSTVDPWDNLQPFSYGQAPFEKLKGVPPLETPTDGARPK